MCGRAATLVTALVVVVALMAAPNATAATDATLNVVHGVPGLTVTVCLHGNPAILDFTPGEVVSGVPAGAGDHEVTIVADGDPCSAAVLQAGVRLEAGKSYTAVAHLTADGDPKLSLFRNNVRPLKPGTARLVVRHTAAAPAVDVFANGARIFEGVENDDSAAIRSRRGSTRPGPR